MYSELYIGNAMIVNGLSHMDLWRSRKDPIGVLKFQLKDDVQNLTLTKGLQVELFFGYDPEETAKAFSGKLDLVDGLAARARDKMTDVIEAKLVQNFMRATPQEIISQVMRKADVKKYEITLASFPCYPFVASGDDGYNLIKKVNRKWQLDYDPYFDVNEVFHWHPKVEQDSLLVFKYGENIINLDFDGESQQGSLLTIGVPTADHSQLISLEHPKVPAAEVLVDTAHHFTDENGNLRTELIFSLV
jgi:hypothetical protein